MHLAVLAAALVSAGSARADVFQSWTDLAASQATAAKQLPFAQTRTMAMLHLAMFEAINGTDGPYQTYLQRPPSGPGVAAAAVAPGNDALPSATAAVGGPQIVSASPLVRKGAPKPNAGNGGNACATRGVCGPSVFWSHTGSPARR